MEHLWEAICFVLFVALIFKPTKKVLYEYLDKYTASVSSRIDEVEAIIKEAKSAYNYYNTQSERLTEQMIVSEKESRENVERILESGRNSLHNIIEQRYRIHKERLEIYKQGIISQFKVESLTKAVAISSLYIRDHHNKELSKEDLDQTILAFEKKKIILH